MQCRAGEMEGRGHARAMPGRGVMTWRSLGSAERERCSGCGGERREHRCCSMGETACLLILPVANL
jgi:hypothetical protein